MNFTTHYGHLSKIMKIMNFVKYPIQVLVVYDILNPGSMILDNYIKFLVKIGLTSYISIHRNACEFSADMYSQFLMKKGSFLKHFLSDISTPRHKVDVLGKAHHSSYTNWNVSRVLVDFSRQLLFTILFNFYHK